MTSYLDATLPNRSEHLWRYTPWSRVHPGSVDTVPTVDSAVVKSEELEIVNKTFQPLSTTDIARIFLNEVLTETIAVECDVCLLYTSPSPRDISGSRMPSSA